VMRATPRVAELEQIYRDTFPRFVAVATAITRNDAAGADAVHDAFVSCVRGLAGFRGEGTLEAWVWKAVINAARRSRRDAERRGREDVFDSPAAGNGRGDDLSSVRLALALLPERQRLVLFLRYYADLDYRAIAEALDIAEGTVGSTLNQAHAALRSCLAQEVPND
jgi:RNA polymerase sigma factor (sigma-70 family)